jgi:putative PIN family toxin of toxin-antitoxin system
MKNKTVFDVNIWISCFISGKTAEIVEMIINDDVVLHRSAELTDELTEVMRRPKLKKYFPDGISRYIGFYEVITEYYTTRKIFSACLDPEDNYLFDLAYQSDARFLVSGDKAVLATPVKPSLSVLKHRNVLKILSCLSILRFLSNLRFLRRNTI